MKRIYSALVVVFAFCALAPNVSAQDWQAYKDLRYRKTISEPNTDGIYTITLESFLNGDAQMKAVPCDVVLVLDMSGSMRWPMGKDESGNTSDERKKAMVAGVKAFIEAIDDNDKYLVPDDGDPNTPRIKRAKRLGNRIGMVEFHGSSASEVIKLTGLGGTTTATALDVNNTSGKRTLINKIDNIGTPNDGTPADKGMAMAYDWLKVGSSQMDATRLIRTAVLFTDGAPGSGNYWTNTGDYGKTTWDTANRVINTANDIRNIGTAANKIKSRVYTISIIANTSMTDYVKVYLGKSSSNWKDATSMGKSRTNGWNSQNIWSSGGEKGGTQVAGPNPTNMTDKGNFAFQTVDANELKKIFEKIASDSSGSSEAGASSTTQVDVISSSFMLPPNSTSNTIKVYTVRYTGDDSNGNPTFKQKQLVDEDNQPVLDDENNPIYVEDLVEIPTSTDTYTWTEKTDDGHEIIHSGVDIDNSITKLILPEGSSNPNQISITGFDYANLWCGPDDSVLSGDYPGWHQGYKLVVKIPIQMATGAVGGPNLNTNESTSGFIINGSLVAQFNKPAVSLPVNIHVQKEGLAVGESAKFTIQRKTSDATTWDYVTSIFVTRTSESDDKPIVKIIGLPATDNSATPKPYLYRVVEDNWNWSYKLTGIKNSEGESIGDLTSRSATTDELDINPFIFVNEKKDNIDVRVKNAETKSFNTFLPGNTEGSYVDSKPRTNTTPSH